MRRTILLLVAVALMLAMVVTPVAAAPPVPAAGVWSWTNGVIVEENVTPSGIVSFTGTEEGSWTGTFVGTSQEVFWGRFFPSGAVWAELTIYFEGSVGEAQGTLEIKIHAFTHPSDLDTMYGDWVIMGGTDELASLHGQGTWTFDYCDEWCHGNYSGMVNFAP